MAWTVTAVALQSWAAAPKVVPIPQAFDQEVAAHHDAEPGLPAGAVQVLDHDGTTLRALVAGRWYLRGGGGWAVDDSLPAAVGDVVVFAAVSGDPVEVPVPASDVVQVIRAGERLWVLTAGGLFEITADGSPRRMPLPDGGPRRLHHAAARPDGELWLATSAGLFRRPGDAWEKVPVVDRLGRDWTAGAVLAVTWDSAGRPWVATAAGVSRRDADGWTCFDGAAGLPWNEFTAAAAGPRGEVWFATRRGLIRWDDRGFHYRQGPRWLPADDVRQLVVGADGTAWAATESGLGCIARRPMTLQEKAEHYEAEIERHIARTPFGFVATARLATPGDRDTAAAEDTDNDGLWTAMYGAGECFAYAATGSEASLRRARRAFEALRFLQVVTQGGSPSPDPGYVARTIRATTDPDPNLGRLDADRRMVHRDALWKVYEPRWPRSADGAWFWKGDCSSDELDGHYFFYPLYYDLCVEDEAEKARVQEVVRRLTDHLLDHDYALVDVDGRPTRWAVFGPARLNADPHWWVERGLNSLSMLSYLAVAAHVTGDDRYNAAARTLVERHGYAQNLMLPKVQQGPGSGNQSDDEMAFMCLYSLLLHGRDPDLVSRGRTALFHAWVGEAAECNPFFNFVCAAANGNAEETNAWGRYSVAPWEGWLEDAATTLRGFPLDRLDWPHVNSHRLDVVRLGRHRARDITEPAVDSRGHRTDGRVLPVENRHFAHWNTDPWNLDYIGQGEELASGTVFLLPYYMGLHHGYIEKP